MTNVFVSRPNWLPERFSKGLRVFLSRLDDMGLKPRTLGTTDYPTKAPLDEVIKLMADCRGAVILGYPQIEVTSGFVKDETISGLSLSTEWNHIEAGLAYARGLPLLVIHHAGVCRGIFDRGALNSFLFSKDLTDSEWAVGEDISGAIRSWRDEVLGFSPSERPVMVEMRDAISKSKDTVWTVEAIGRRIGDPRPVGSSHRERAECKIEELTDYYVRIRLLATNEHITIPYNDIVLSYDDERHRNKIQVRAQK